MTVIKWLVWSIVAMLALIGGYNLATAKEIIVGPVTADVRKIYDGDTLHVTARPWIGQTVRVSVRVIGIDSPELRAKCPKEKEMALQAKALTKQLVAGQPVKLWLIQTGKYAGRVLARVETANGDIATQLIGAGLARAYDGGARQGWCG